MTDRPRGRAGQRLLRAVLNKGGPTRICWLCGHPGADTMDHVLPHATHPHLTWSLDNLQPAHGRSRSIAVDGYTCQGNYARGKSGPPTTSATSRDW